MKYLLVAMLCIVMYKFGVQDGEASARASMIPTQEQIRHLQERQIHLFKEYVMEVCGEEYRTR